MPRYLLMRILTRWKICFANKLGCKGPRSQGFKGSSDTKRSINAQCLKLQRICEKMNHVETKRSLRTGRLKKCRALICRFDKNYFLIYK